MIRDPSQDGRHLGLNLTVRESEDSQSPPFYLRLAFGIFIPAAYMRRTIHLYDEVRFSAVEVDYEATNRVLTAEPETQKSSVTQTIPQK